MSKRTLWQRLTHWLLVRAERRFLLAHGWVPAGQDVYYLPKDYPFKRKSETYSHPHAVNAQKQASGVAGDIARGAPRALPSEDLETRLRASILK